ncbi:hypothetical protein [Clostridium botulinum]|uniref:hypothetical protein n=1 Tax=Clostridium botulinum TaxID=1491 RepID=UPI001C9AAD51|nr:hypothetical protein [Clostridium botulinum]MBY6842813.1 hypothetical protein [Clostridium botulinum]
MIYNHNQKRFLEMLKKDNTTISKHCLKTACDYCKYYNSTHGTDANYSCPLLVLKKQEQKKEYEEMRKELLKLKDV